MASAAVCVHGLRAPLLLSSSGKAAFLGEPSTMSANSPSPVLVSPSTLRVRAAALSGGGRPPNIGGSRTTSDGTGTRGVKKLKVIEEGDKSGKVRDKERGGTASIKLLSRVEQLKLLSKAEKAGLLSAAENAGFSLSSIEKLGLLSKAEKFGALSAATDPKTPALLLAAALGLLVLGPAFVYFVPEDSTPLVVVQVVVALVSVLGGSAAYAASSFVSALQSSD